MSKNVEALIEILNDKAKDAIYRSVWCEHVKEDIRTHMGKIDIELPEEDCHNQSCL